MPNRWNVSTERLRARIRRNGARWAIQSSIIATGGIVAAGTIHGTTYLNKQPVVTRIVESAKTPRLAVKPAVEASGAALALDAGVEHASISRWVQRLATPSFSRLLQRKDKYDDMITAKLDSAGMPRDLVYLAMIESEFNPNAKSRVAAVGMWQFMSGTARQLGLKVRGGTDERRDPARSTDAAITYLSSLKDDLGSWYLAAAAYNSGAGTVRKALRRVTGRTTGTDEDFFRIMSVLPKETRDYVPKLIAASRVGNDPQRYGVTFAENDGDVAANVVQASFTSDGDVKNGVVKNGVVKNGVAKNSVARKSVVKKSVVKKSAVKKKRSVKSTRSGKRTPARHHRARR